MNARASSLIAAADDILRQGCVLLEAVTPAVYREPLEGPSGATIGAHYRHVLDHFQCLLDGVRHGEINYDRRRRSPTMEGSPAAAFAATELLREEFWNLPAGLLQKECSVVYSVGYGSNEAELVQSNVARELMFCVGHAIHHYAILKLLCAARAVGLPYEFGVAPSTLKHLAAQAVR